MVPIRSFGVVVDLLSESGIHVVTILLFCIIGQLQSASILGCSIQFFLKQFQTATEVLISAKCSSQRLPLPTVKVPVAIHATDDDIILTDISSWADLPARKKHEQIVRSLGNLQSRMRQYITNVD